MKVSKTKLLANRGALITTASRLIQDRGFDGAGVAEISRQAGLTEGAFYSQFESKGALAAEACRHSFAHSTGLWNELPDGAMAALTSYLEAYLSETHLENVGTGCPLAANAGEVRRQDAAVGRVFVEGFCGMVERLQRALATAMPPELARRRALALMTAMAGTVALVRALRGTDPTFAEELLVAVREELKPLAKSSCD
jgi:TetR/AcrR family transcriptional repressor of nem operon